MPAGATSAAGASDGWDAPQACAARLELNTAYVEVEGVPYGTHLSCADTNSSCMAALATVVHFGRGVLAHRVQASDEPDPSIVALNWRGEAANVFGVGPQSETCALDSAQLKPSALPCVSGPFSSLAYRDSCGLTVHAGCGDGAADGNSSDARR